MKQVSKKRTSALLLLDISMIAAELWALGSSWQEQGAKLFRYYTQNSNLLALIVCIICTVQGVRRLRGGKMPRWVRSLRYYSACCLTFTLLVAGFLLTPVDSGLSFSSFMLEGKYLWLHTLCPVIAVIQLFLQPGRRFHESHALRALLPTILYGAISLLLNAAGAYSGPYPFLRIREQAGYVTAVGCIAVLAVDYFAARVLAALSCIPTGKKMPEP